ncbi:MAG: sensor histidine kinase, partial [Rhodothermales bacterium]
SPPVPQVSTKARAGRAAGRGQASGEHGSNGLAWHHAAKRRPPSSTRNLTVIAGVSAGRGGTFPPFSPKKAVLFRLFVESCAPYVGTIESSARIQQQLETIRKSELEQRRLSLIATTTHSGVIITDAQGCIEWVNDAFTTNTGYDLDEVKGLKPKDFLQAPGLNDADTLRNLSRALAAKENVSVDLKNVKKSGDTFYIRLDVTPVFDREQRLINYIGIQQDITEGKVNQEQLESQNEELTKINQELDQFVYSISHDLRAPLLSIQGLLDLVELDDQEDGNGVYLKMIAESVTRLDHTILEILNYSRNARLDVHPVEFNFRTYVDDLVSDLSNLRPDVEMVVQWNGQETVRLDEVRVGVLLKNIVSNALKYSKQDEADAEVLIEVQVEAEQCTVRVTDTGQGIGEEHLQKVFDMFYRATRKGSGTGLGLYICKEIVDKLNGTLSLESTLGEGTVVEFTLPQ